MDETSYTTSDAPSSGGTITACTPEPNVQQPTHLNEPLMNISAGNNKEDSVFIPLETNDLSLNVFSNTSYTDDNGDVTPPIDNTKQVTSNNTDSMKRRPPPPNFEPPPATASNEHQTLQNRHSAPPSSPPPVFMPESPTHPSTTVPAELQKKGEGSDDDGDVNDNVLQTDCTEYGDNDDDAEIYPKGILRHRSSVRDPNNVQGRQKNVTFDKLPKRRDEPNPCVLLVLFIVFIISAISFLLVLLLAKGTIKPPCSCKEEIKESETELMKKQLNCPVGWSVGKSSCYGTVTGERMEYSTARSMCAIQGAYVLSLETKTESEWFTRNILTPRKTMDQNVGDIFLGIKPNRNRDDQYTWESNNKFVGWKYGLPPATNGSCFVVASNDTTSWLNVDCDIKHNFYCEKSKYISQE